MKKYDVICSGYISLDQIIRIDQASQVGKTALVTNSNHRQIYYGGCHLNVAYALSHLNKCALPLLRVGDDYQSTGLKDYLEQSSIALDALSFVKGESTSSAYLIEDPEANHVTLFYPGSMSGKYAKALPDAWFHESQIGLMTVASKEDNQYFLDQCQKHQLPLFLGMKMDSDAFEVSFLRKILTFISGLFTNESEAACVLDMMGVNKMGDLFDLLPNLQMLVMTKGKAGSMAYYRHQGQLKIAEVGIVKTDHCIDSVGSGDAYIAGFLYGYLNHQPMKTCMEYGATLATFALEGMGATTNLPSEDDFLKRHQINFIGESKDE